MSFHFNLGAAEVLELIDLIDAFEGHHPTSLAQLKHAIGQQLPPAFHASRLSGTSNFHVSHLSGTSEFRSGEGNRSRPTPYPTSSLRELSEFRSREGHRSASYPNNKDSIPHSAGPSGNCARGGRKKIAPRLWDEVSEPFIEQEKRARIFLREIISHVELLCSNSCLPWVQEIKKTLTSDADRESFDATDSTLYCAVKKCRAAGSKAYDQTFNQLLAQMEFSKVIDGYVTLTSRPYHLRKLLSLLRSNESLNISKLYDTEKGRAGNSFFPGFSTFAGWNTAGRKLCRLAAGGTLYLLAIIVGMGKVREATRLLEKEVTCISNILRHPSGKDFEISRSS